MKKPKRENIGKPDSPLVSETSSKPGAGRKAVKQNQVPDRAEATPRNKLGQEGAARKIMVVLGMHRSGTSTITRGLQELGVGLGDNLMPALPNNPKGFWEDMEIYDLSERLLQAVGLRWDSLSKVSPARWAQPDIDDFRLEAVDLVAKKTATCGLWGFKDPRTVRLLPFWKSVFDALLLEPCYVISLRNPLSVAKSLRERDGFAFEKSAALWLEHTILSVSHSAGYPRVVVDYDQLMHDPVRELERMAVSLGLPAPPSEQLQASEYVTDFLASELRHTQYNAAALSVHSTFAGVVKETYELLLNVATDGSAPDALQQSEPWLLVERTLLEVSAFLAYAEDCERELTLVARTAHAKAAEYEDELRKRDEQIAAIGQAMTERAGQIASLAQAVADRDGQIASLAQVAAERDGQIASLAQAVAERDGRIASLAQAVAERDGRITSLAQAVAERGEGVAHRDAQISALNHDRTRLAADLAKVYSSSSWRVTAPFRLLKRSFPRMRPIIGKLIKLVYRMVPLPIGIKLKIKALLFFLFKPIVLNTASYRAWVGFKNRKSIAPDQIPADPVPVSIPDAFPACGSGLSVVPHYIDPALDSADGFVVPKGNIAIHVHLYYTEMLDQLVSYLKSMPIRHDLYVSVPETCDSVTVLAELTAALPKVGKIIVETVPNRGRDIAPFIIQFGSRLAEYEIIAHFHTKKSPHNSSLADWCTDILDLLLGFPGSSGGRVAHIIALLRGSAKIVYSEGHNYYIRDRSGWSDNHDLARRVLEQYSHIAIDDFPVIDFPEGSMFWARAECLREFLALPLSYADFPPEPIPADGTLAHALERLILVFAHAYKGQCVRLHKGDSIPDYRHYEEQRDYAPSVVHQDIKVLSYYLPQFHPIPENDSWHGQGFTEWTKVRAANPLFAGHHQQHIPHPDIGYYLLESPDILKKQAEMMRQAGIYGQVFYHYWFSGNLILEGPARLLLDAPDIDMPFCFCWANENWTRRWDGNEQEILLKQDYSVEDARAFIRYLIPFFKDARYITIDNRPVLFVYRPSSIPDTYTYLGVWERECAACGIDRPYVVAVLTRGATTPHDFGMDAGVERVLHDWTAGAVSDIKGSLQSYQDINGSVLPYDEVAGFYVGQTEFKNFTYFRSLVPTWDNTARYGSEAYLLHGSTPQRFQKWLESTIQYSKSTLPEDRRLVLVNAWNEWAEGAHLEPDSRFGYSYLNAVGRALSGIPYAKDLNPVCSIPQGLRLHFSFPEVVLVQLRSDSWLKKRFTFGLSRSTIFNACRVSLKAPELFEELPLAVQAEPEEADLILEFRRVAFFDPSVIEKMVQTALNSPGSVVIANGYDRHIPLIKITENGSVDSCHAHTAPLLIMPRSALQKGYKNFRMRTDAHGFVAYPNTQKTEELPAVTTIIRFHKSADFDPLKKALYCLAAMRECVVMPLIAAQDLSKQQIAALESALDDVPWADGIRPLICHYHSLNGDGDLRSRMLNESLRQVRTRYAAFLDFDDLLMSHAYDWLISRLKQTGKAVSFGRVYATSYDGNAGLLLERKCTYEYGCSYDEFLRLNHAPLHSFMLDLSQLDLNRVTYYEDQRYMEDYFLTLQLFTRDNVDWASLEENAYIGDYIHSIDRSHTLAFSNELERKKILSDSEYMICEQRICDLRDSLT